MAAGSRHINLDGTSPSIARPHAIRPARDLCARAGAAGLELANDLLSRSVGSLDLAEQSLERLRQNAGAIEVTYWMVTGDTIGCSAACVLRVGDHTVGRSLPTLTISEPSIAQRLRHPGVILGSAGTVTGLEDLVTAPASSHAVLSCANDAGVAGALVLAWDSAHPPVDDTAVSHLQIAAGALLRTLLGERLAGTRIVAARDEERTRIARELHDDLGQQAALLAAKLETLMRSPAASTAALRAGIAEAQRNVQDLAVSLHRLSHELHSPRLKLLGLAKTLESMCKNVSKGSGVNVRFRATSVPAGIPEHLSLCICRVAQEALQNAVKHSGAQEVEMTLRVVDSELRLRVSDSGRGFDPASPADGGIGLTTMRDRVELTGGRLVIHASPSNGATVEAAVPFLPLR